MGLQIYLRRCKNKIHFGHVGSYEWRLDGWLISKLASWVWIKINKGVMICRDSLRTITVSWEEHLALRSKSKRKMNNVKLHNKELYTLHSLYNIVTDLINALPDNSSINMAQHATIEEAVFSVSAVTSHSGGWWSCDTCFLWCVSVSRLYKWQNSFASGKCQFSVGDTRSYGKFVDEEEYKKSACEDLTCDLKTLCCSAVILGVCDLVRLL
jgi:hypothetical protein